MVGAAQAMSLAFCAVCLKAKLVTTNEHTPERVRFADLSTSGMIISLADTSFQLGLVKIVHFRFERKLRMKNSILRGAAEAVELAQQYKDGRFRRWVAPTPEQIKGIRNRMELSQAAFAHLFGFDVTTLRSWEQGKRVPGNDSCLLLKLINHDPNAVLRLIKESKEEKNQVRALELQ
jgi:putative transcriptional regulator